MSSSSAAAIDRRRLARVMAMTPAERVALVVRLGREGLASYAETHGVDRATAVARIQVTRRLGRRRSACSAASDR